VRVRAGPFPKLDIERVRVGKIFKSH
jgi:hypothetical protein